ncbi:hypothetical protein [Ramlibacter sp. WS9]|uniref:hypothetical protein n=1 Tax=Ramlibacter sp. WS9 TaxID=1882741 RepID=UPI0011418ACF|nr:hypothetical protein [Ramlibacter sp. WS9]ROZ71475.1 hypothetical protein EEB15_20725 [Ramlibacter sp. WS9]
MAPSSQIFQAWREADRAALKMELEFAQACMREMPGDPPESWEERRQKLHEIRERAHELFVLAMEDMTRRANDAAACRRRCSRK